MPDSLTSNYHWVKPEPGSSPTTWGVKVNSDLDGIDSQVKTTADSVTAASSAAAAAQTTANTAQTTATAAQASATAAAAAGVPIGGMVVWGTGTAPAHFFLCDGTVRANTAAPALAALFGTTFGGVSGTSFGVPDLRGAVPFGVAPGDPIVGVIGTHLSAAADAGSDFDYVVLNFIVRYQ